MSDPIEPLQSDNESEVYSALIKIGKTDQRDREPDVAGFLEHPSAALRSAAIRVLGFYWRLPAYGERAAQMARGEPDDNARAVAIMAWCAYNAGTKDARVLRDLFAMFDDKALPRRVRQAAYMGMMEVGGLSHAEQAKATPNGPFEDSIDWDLVRTTMNGTGIEPAAQTSLVARLRVRKVTYDHGLAHKPSGGVGHVSLSFNGEVGMVTLVHDRGGATQEWQAFMPPETWRILIATLHDNEFPKPATIIEGPVPGSSSTTISWERRGQLETVLIAGRSPDYRDVNRIAWTIMAQIAPDLIGEYPSELRFPGVQVERAYHLK
jgi:hypothetical protein